MMQEVTEVHTRLLRLTLCIDDSRTYWANATPGEPLPAVQVFEESWFGHKSQDRVELLLRNLRHRFDAYPIALEVLHKWHDMDVQTGKLICHWHTQLGDPLYRQFAAWLAERRLVGPSTIRRHEVIEWVEAEQPGRWAEATQTVWARKLLGAAFEVGLVGNRRDPRTLTAPTVTNDALAYLLYLLRELNFSGSVVDNPYLSSVGLEGGLLADRIRQLPGISMNRLGDLVELAFEGSSLNAWFEARQ